MDMKEHIAIIIRQVENWNLHDLERLYSELECQIDNAEAETCMDCGNRPQNGACSFCKAD
jgi:hypothetical protein